MIVLFHLAVCHVNIELGGVNAAVAQELLDGGDRYIGPDQARGIGMA